MKINLRRFDPYKNFKFRVAIGAALAGIAGLFLVKKATSAKSSPKSASKAPSAKPAAKKPTAKRSTKAAAAKPATRRAKPRKPS